MDFSEVDHALEELENRIERLKALYEQYFMGIEKLEPLVPRKDVDRRIVLLRREQVRNTAQRFKFQTLVQRYNSFQQSWARVAREIDNGTYHRDVARAAARFGAKETLTIFGKRQAEKYQRLVASQDARRTRRTTTHTIDEEMIADDDLLFVDDEQQADDMLDVEDESRPTPVIPKPHASAPPLPLIAPVPPPPRASTPGMASVPPPLPPVARASGQMPAPIVSLKDETPEEFDLQDTDIVEFVTDKPERKRKIRPDTMYPIMMRRPSEAMAKVSEPAPPEASAVQRSQAMPVDPEAGKRRVAALAAQVKQRSTVMPQGAASRTLDLELDLGQGPRAREEPVAKAGRALDLDFDRGLQIREEAPAQAERPAPRPAPSAESEGLTGHTQRRVDAPRAAVLPETREIAAAEATRDGAEERARVAAAARQRAASARELGGDADGLSEKRIRQIYGEYVDAKRAVKQSTAGITYDTLATQLRQQAEKLAASHPGRKVDYSVVMKSGTPTLKPILR